MKPFDLLGVLEAELYSETRGIGDDEKVEFWMSARERAILASRLSELGQYSWDVCTPDPVMIDADVEFLSDLWRLVGYGKFSSDRVHHKLVVSIENHLGADRVIELQNGKWTLMSRRITEAAQCGLIGNATGDLMALAETDNAINKARQGQR